MIIDDTITHSTNFDHNKGCVGLANAPCLHPLTRHNCIKCHHFHHHVSKGDIKVQWIDTKHQLAYNFTKPLPTSYFHFQIPSQSFTRLVTSQSERMLVLHTFGYKHMRNALSIDIFFIYGAPKPHRVISLFAVSMSILCKSSPISLTDVNHPPSKKKMGVCDYKNKLTVPLYDLSLVYLVPFQIIALVYMIMIQWTKAGQ
jgi:hypothetical protein